MCRGLPAGAACNATACLYGIEAKLRRSRRPASPVRLAAGRRGRVFPAASRPINTAALKIVAALEILEPSRHCARSAQFSSRSTAVTRSHRHVRTTTLARLLDSVIHSDLSAAGALKGSGGVECARVGARLLVRCCPAGRHQGALNHRRRFARRGRRPVSDAPNSAACARRRRRLGFTKAPLFELRRLRAVTCRTCARPRCFRIWLVTPTVAPLLLRALTSICRNCKLA